MLSRKHISCYSIDCINLLCNQGEFRCRKSNGFTNVVRCMDCKFNDLRKKEDAIRRERRHG